MTPRHCVRRQWNEATSRQRAIEEKRQLLVCWVTDRIQGRARNRVVIRYIVGSHPTSTHQIIGDSAEETFLRDSWMNQYCASLFHLANLSAKMTKCP